MKKICIIFLALFIITLTAVGFSDGKTARNTANADEYLRIHIRADSNEKEAQAVKYLVRDGVVAYLTPLVAGFSTKRDALDGIQAHLEEISAVATAVLLENGFSYGAKAGLKQEVFPTRVYDGYTLPSGEYSALILTLGEGEGDNWWCVVYPPLCFTGGQTAVVYKSKIREIIRRFYED